MKKLPPSILAVNRAAKFHYEILVEFNAGIILTGQEVKSLRTNRAKLAGVFVTIDGNDEAWLQNLNIAEYRYARGQPHAKTRKRKLLLTTKELTRIARELNEKGVALIALDLHLKNNQIKVRLALGRGKKKWDKRETIKRRDIDRDLRRSAQKL